MDRYGITLKEMQLLAYFVGDQGYTLVSVQQRPNDLWLVRPRHRHYPILHLCSCENKKVESELLMLRQVHRALCDLIHRESKIIILNVHENASDFENEFVQQITLRESCDPRFESSFPKVRHQLISVDDEQQERSQLARKMEHAGKKRFGWRERLLLIPRYALMIAAFVAGATLIQFLLMRLDASMLADIDPFVLAFLDHTSVTSLFVLLQLPALFAASMLCDGLYHRGTLFIAFASVCFASLFSLFSNSAVFSSSLSALIFGLWSAGVIDVWMAHAYRHPLIRRQFYRQLFWMVIAALVPGNEWMSVFGGVLGALLAAMCIGKSAFHSKMRTHAMAAFATLIVAVAVWMAIDGSQIYQEHASLEASYQIADVHAK